MINQSLLIKISQKYRKGENFLFIKVIMILFKFVIKTDGRIVALYLKKRRTNKHYAVLSELLRKVYN